MASKAAGRRKAERRVGEILDRSAAYYADILWKSRTGDAVRERLTETGISPKVLRRFGIGYAPTQPGDLLEHLSRWRYSASEMEEAGIVTRSGRRHLHARFHSRVMFPVRAMDGTLAGFTGMATHLGPSWPLWLASPERELFAKASLLFGFDRAGPAIAAAGSAKVLNDCLEVLRYHERGEAGAVSVVQSPITAAHLDLLASALSVEQGELETIRRPRGGPGSGPLTLVGPRDKIEGVTAEPAREAVMPIPRGGQRGAPGAPEPDPVPALPAARPLRRWGKERVLRALSAAALGTGLPLAWLWIVSPSHEATNERGLGFGLVALGVGSTYVLLALGGARISA